MKESGIIRSTTAGFYPSTKKRARLLLLALLLTGAATPEKASAQQQQLPSPPAATAVAPTGEGAAPVAEQVSAAAAPTSSSERYRIGPGDLLDIRVFSRPQLSRESVRVDDDRGTIQMPWIQKEILAVCRTERELGEEISNLYRKYLRNPQVDVFIKDYQSKPVAVIGAVNSPGQFQLRRRVRLLELLTQVNGPTLARAGRTIQVIRPDKGPACASDETVPAPPVAAGEDVAAMKSVTSYSLNDVLRGVDEANPYMQPGDIVTVLEAEQVFVVGNVMKPAPVALRGPMTVSQAVAMAGGVMPDSKTERVRVIRQTPAGKEEIFVNLKAIDKREAWDIALQANDIVDVPSSMTGGKKIVQSILRSFFPAIAQLPIRVIH